MASKPPQTFLKENTRIKNASDIHKGEKDKNNVMVTKDQIIKARQNWLKTNPLDGNVPIKLAVEYYATVGDKQSFDEWRTVIDDISETPEKKVQVLEHVLWFLFEEIAAAKETIDKHYPGYVNIWNKYALYGWSMRPLEKTMQEEPGD